MKTKDKKHKYNQSIGERIEEFLHSDSCSANVTKYLLMTIATGGIVFGGAVLPGILKAIKDLNEGFDEMERNSKKFSKKKINNALGNIKRQKLIKIIKNKDGKFVVKLTNKGSMRVKKYSFETLKIKKPEKWDGKWRIFIFDIPTNPAIMNQAREVLRKKIKDLGFSQMQKSVWVYPYECEDELLFIAEMFGVQKYIEIITGDKVLHEKILKKKFKL
jgi:hypothetical protein